MAKQVYSPPAVPAACFYDVMLQQGMWTAEVHVHEMLLTATSQLHILLKMIKGNCMTTIRMEGRGAIGCYAFYGTTSIQASKK